MIKVMDFFGQSLFDVNQVTRLRYFKFSDQKNYISRNFISDNLTFKHG